MFLFMFARKPAVIMIVGVNGGGKTTSLGKTRSKTKHIICNLRVFPSDAYVLLCCNYLGDAYPLSLPCTQLFE